MSNKSDNPKPDGLCLEGDVSFPRWLYWLLLGLAFAAFGWACLFEIAKYWQPGHDGFLGASYTRSAINSMRFGIVGPVKFYLGADMPEASRIYTHHPLLLHLNVIPVLALLGEAEWVARLVPVTYSLGILVVLYAIAQRYFGRGTALISVVVFALLPIHSIFASVVNREQGTVFWSLLFLYAYMRWIETDDWHYFLGIMGGVTFAVQYDWPGYYMALLVVIHAFIYGLLNLKSLQWRREFTFVVVFSVVVLANAGAFFSYVWYVEGGFGDLFGAFGHRNTRPENFWGRQWTRLIDLYGYIPLAVFGLWAVDFLARLLRLKGRFGDLVPAFFVAMQIAHTWLFKQAAHIHSYWVYYLGVAVAIGIGDLLWRSIVRATGWLEAVFAYLKRESVGLRTRRWCTVLVFGGIVGVPMAYHTPHTIDEFMAFRAKGTSKYLSNYEDLYEQTNWIQRVARRFDSEPVDFAVHKSLPDDFEWTFYLANPYEYVDELAPPHKQRVGPRPTALLLDLKYVADRTDLPALADDYSVSVYNRRFVVIGGGRGRDSFEAYTYRRREASIWWNWLVNWRHPPGKWVPDPDPELARSAIETQRAATEEFWSGNSGGYPVAWACPDGAYLQGFRAHQTGEWWEGISGLKPVCGQLNVKDGKVEIRPLRREWAPFYGDRHEQGQSRDMTCRSDEALVGIKGRSGKYTDALGIICARPVVVTNDSGQQKLEFVEHREGNEFGGDGGSPFKFVCPDGSAASAFLGRVGWLLDSVGIRCTAPDEVVTQAQNNE